MDCSENPGTAIDFDGAGFENFWKSETSKWHVEVQFQEWFLGPEKIDHKKLAIRKNLQF